MGSNLCPMNRLPIELLSHIFDFVQPAEYSTEPEKSHSPPRWLPELQIRFSHVCRRWRNVVISTPSLWTEILVDKCLPSRAYNLIGTMLERSQNLAIDITIVDSCLDDPHEDNDRHVDFTVLFSMLLPHIHRWASVCVVLEMFDAMLPLLNGISDHSHSPATRLTTFELYCYGDFRCPTASQHLALFGGSVPMLTRVALAQVPIDWAQPWIASASHLKDLYLYAHQENDRPSWAQFSTILRDEPIHLPRLAFFELAHCSPSQAIALFWALYLPALTHLTLDLSAWNFTALVQTLVGPVRSPSSLRSASTQPHTSLLHGLQSIRITQLECDAACVALLYGELVNVTSLELSMKYLPSRFFDVLCMPCPLGGIWLPRLQRLYISDASRSAVKTFVQGRHALGTPLEALFLTKDSEVPECDVAWLRKNVNVVESYVAE